MPSALLSALAIDFISQHTPYVSDLANSPAVDTYSSFPTAGEQYTDNGDTSGYNNADADSEKAEAYSSSPSSINADALSVTFDPVVTAALKAKIKSIKKAEDERFEASKARLVCAVLRIKIAGRYLA